MTITTRDQLINSLANNCSNVIIDKVSLASTATGQYFSLFTAAGLPAPGVTPITTGLCTNSTLGAFKIPNNTLPASGYLAWMSLSSSNAVTCVEIHDRIAQTIGLNSTVTTAQGPLDLNSFSPSSVRIGASNYSEIQWWLEWYVQTGGTATTANVAVTYNDDTSGTIAVAIAATTRVGRMLQITPVAGKFIKAVVSVTLTGSTGTAGSFGVVVTRPRTSASLNLINKVETFDWAQLGLARIPNDSCLFFVMICQTSSTGILRGHVKIANG